MTIREKFEASQPDVEDFTSFLKKRKKTRERQYISIYFDKKIKNKVDLFAKDQGVSTASIINGALICGLKAIGLITQEDVDDQ